MRNPLDTKGLPGAAGDRLPGAAPGLLVAPEGSPHPVIDVVVSGTGGWSLHEDVTVAALRTLHEDRPPGTWLWLDVNGLGAAGVIADIGEMFGFHKLSLEDALNLHQRPKTERYDSYQYLVLQQPYLLDGELDFEQVSLFWGRDTVVTLQAYRDSQLLPLRERLERGAPRLMNSRADYMAYAALDVLVDGVFPVLEAMDDRIEMLEETLLTRRRDGMVAQIHALRGEVNLLRRVLWNQTLMAEQVAAIESDLLQEDTRPYLRDVQDHACRALGLAEQQREACAALYELHASVATTQLNEIMKVLTVISTLFIPLTFIVGVYGMNFRPEAGPLNMPELTWRYGYLFVWALMVSSVLGMLWMFRRRGWLGGGR